MSSGEIILRKKWAYVFLFVLGFGGTLLCIRLRERTYEGVAVVQLRESKAGSGASLLISQTKAIVNPMVIEKAVLMLEGMPADFPAEKMQKRIFEFQKELSTAAQGNSGIIQVKVKNISGKEAVRRVNAVVDAFEEISRFEAGAELRQMEEYLQRQIQNSRRNISDLETRVNNFERNAPPPGVREKLESEIAAVSANRQKLLKVFTPKHPEVVKLEEVIGHLQRDIEALPKAGGNIEYLKNELAQAREAAQALFDQHHEAILKGAAETGNVHILKRAVNPVKVKTPFGIKNFLSAVFFGLLPVLIAFAADLRKPPSLYR